MRSVVVLAVGVACGAGCSLILDSEQCSVDGDCASRGEAFRNTVCQRGFCVLASLQDASDNDAGEDASPDAGEDADGGASLPGDTCDTPVLVPLLATSTSTDAGMVLSAQTTDGFGSNYTFGAGCVPGTGPDRIYKVTVPNGTQLTVDLAPGSFDGVINIDAVDGPNGTCPSAVRCSSGARRGGAASYLNAGGQPASVFILAAGSDTVASGTFDLGVRIGSFPAGESCRNPIAIATVPQTLPNQTSVGFGNNYVPLGTPCAPGPGADIVYNVTVAASKTLTVTVTPTGATAWKPSVNIISKSQMGVQACDAVPLACVGQGFAAAPNGVATAQYTNTDSSDQEVFLIVDSVDVGGAGAFTLAVTY